MRDALPGATALMKPSVTPVACHRRFKIGDVGLDGVVAGIGNRRDANRRRRARPGGDAEFRIAVGLGELAAVAAVAEAGQHDLAGLGSTRRHVVQARPIELQPAKALPRIAPPRAIVDALAHRLAEFAVTGDVDADVVLSAHDLGDRLAQRLLNAARRTVRRLHGHGWPRSARPDAAGCRHGWSGYGRDWRA